jgi:hypothetical protein
MKQEDEPIRTPESREAAQSRREFLVAAGVSGLALSAGVLGLANLAAAQTQPPKPTLPPKPLYKGQEQVVLMRGPDGALYLIPQSGLKPYRIPGAKTTEIENTIPEFRKPLGKLPPAVAIRLGLVASNSTTVSIFEPR